MDLKEKRIHAFMEKFMNMRLLMRRTHKKENNARFLLVILHSIDHGNPVMVSQLSQKLEISHAASTQMVNSLVKHGWVFRTHDKEDRRIVWIDLTEQGKDVLKEIFVESTTFMEGMIEYLGDEDFNHLDRILDKVMDYTQQSNYLNH